MHNADALAEEPGDDRTFAYRKGGLFMKRKILAILLSLAMLGGIAGCGNTASTEPESGAGDASAESVETVETAAGDSAEAATEEGDTSSSDAKVADYPMLDNLDLDGTLQPGMYEGKKIVVACSGANYEKVFKIFASLFKEMTGGEVEVQSFPDQLFEKGQMGLSSNQFDIVCMPIAYIHSFAHAGLLTDITEMLETVASPNYDVDDFLTGMYDTYSRYDGMQVAFPFKPDSMVFFYRKDLFEDPEQQAAFKEKYGRDLTVPETPEEMLEVAQFFTKSMNPDSPVEYGYSGVLSKGSSRFTWFNHLGYFGGKELNEDFTPGFTDGSGVEALQFMLDLVECAPEESITFDWDTGNTYFAQGNAAMMEQWPGLYMNCEADDSPTKGKIGYGLVPGGSPCLGGWAMSIAASSPEQEMAFKFCELVTSKDGEYIKAPIEMDPCRASNYERDIFLELGNPVYDALKANLAVASQLADTDVPYVSAQVGDIEEVAIQSALAGEITAEEAVAQIAEEMTNVIDSIKDEL